MWQILALSFTIIGAVIIYLTNKNQAFKVKPLSKKWQVVGYLSWLIAFALWLQTYVFSAAFFMWFFMLSSILICIPFISLVITFNKTKTAKKETHRE